MRDHPPSRIPPSPGAVTHSITSSVRAIIDCGIGRQRVKDSSFDRRVGEGVERSPVRHLARLPGTRAGLVTAPGQYDTARGTVSQPLFREDAGWNAERPVLEFGVESANTRRGPGPAARVPTAALGAAHPERRA